MPGIEILYEDNSIIIAEKPAGIATQSANVRQPDCVSLLKDHIRRSDPQIKGEPYLGVVHRLDQPVAGLLVFAKTPKAAATLSASVSTDMFNKHYRAVVEGIVDVRKETKLIDMMYKDSKENRAVISDQAPQNAKLKEASLIYRTERILPEKERSILSITLLTGRFHQIRAQLSHMGHPIVGDRKYNAVTSYPSGIALVADRLEFIHPDSGEKVEKVVDFSFAL